MINEIINAYEQYYKAVKTVPYETEEVSLLEISGNECHDIKEVLQGNYTAQPVPSELSSLIGGEGRTLVLQKNIPLKDRVEKKFLVITNKVINDLASPYTTNQTPSGAQIFLAAHEMLKRPFIWITYMEDDKSLFDIVTSVSTKPLKEMLSPAALMNEINGKTIEDYVVDLGGIKFSVIETVEEHQRFKCVCYCSSNNREPLKFRWVLRRYDDVEVSIPPKKPTRVKLDKLLENPRAYVRGYGNLNTFLKEAQLELLPEEETTPDEVVECLFDVMSARQNLKDPAAIGILQRELGELVSVARNNKDIND